MEISRKHLLLISLALKHYAGWLEDLKKSAEFLVENDCASQDRNMRLAKLKREISETESLDSMVTDLLLKDARMQEIIDD